MNTSELRIALYARVSTEAQEEDGQSLQTQIAMMRDAAKRIGATVVREYQVQESAMPCGERPSLTRLLKEAASGCFEAVMVCKVDRLARAIEVLRHIEGKLDKFGIALFEGVEQQNLRSAEGRLNRDIQALIGEYSVNRLKWSAAASRLERAHRGWPHSGMLPFARTIIETKDRRSLDAQWGLDAQKLELVEEMYKLYIGKGLNFAQVAKQLGMQPETVRRIMMDQSGPVWARSFVDPATGQQVEVRTAIPPLYTEEQIAQLRVRAKQNQLEREGWLTRGRDYPLSQYLRCSNPNCGWSNLSGHQTRDKRSQVNNPDASPRTYAYYLHLSRKRRDEAGSVDLDCVHNVPAEEIEDEVFSRLGQLLSSATQLSAAVRAAMITDPVKIAELKVEEVSLVAKQKRELRSLGNAMEILVEQRGTAAGMIAQAKINDLNESLANIASRRTEIAEALKVVELPSDFPSRFAKTMQRLVGLHGHMPMHWPNKAKKALLALFFGSKSTRFDRASTNKRSDSRGIFVRKVVPSEGRPYYQYEAKGRIGDFSGALSRVVEVYEQAMSEDVKEQFSRDELQEFAALADSLEGFLSFRALPVASTRWSA